jgi:hypothetical protein
MSARNRMHNDPVFATLVKSMYDIFETTCGTGAGVTPTEIREASGLAWQIYVERHAEPITFKPTEWGHPR